MTARATAPSTPPSTPPAQQDFASMLTPNTSGQGGRNRRHESDHKAPLSHVTINQSIFSLTRLIGWPMMFPCALKADRHCMVFLMRPRDSSAWLLPSTICVDPVQSQPGAVVLNDHARHCCRSASGLSIMHGLLLVSWAQSCAAEVCKILAATSASPSMNLN